MKRILVLFVLVCMLLGSMGTCFAMSQKELNDYRNQMENALANAQSVTWDDLNSDPGGYADRLVKFTGVAVMVSDTSVMLKDANGNKFIMGYSYYRLKEGTEYTMGASFNRMATMDDGTIVALCNYEKAHLPFFSEYELN